MGLDTSHDCWHGAYSAFMRWRTEIARVAGLPPLELMEGFFCPQREDGDKAMMGMPTIFLGGTQDKMVKDSVKRIEERLPIMWNCLKPDALHELLYHSDCDGEIPWESCAAIADSLDRLLPLLPNGEAGGHIGNWRDKTQTFIDGLRDAADKKENVEFH